MDVSSFSPYDSMDRLEWSYTESCEAVKMEARRVVGTEPCMVMFVNAMLQKVVVT